MSGFFSGLSWVLVVACIVALILSAWGPAAGLILAAFACSLIATVLD